MKGFKFAIVFILFIIAIPNLAYSQSARDVYKSLKKLESKIEIGINYKDYSSVLGDINYEVKEFLDSREAKKKPKLAESIKIVMTHHKNGLTVWKDHSLTDYFMPGGIVRWEEKDTGIIRFKRGEVDNNSFDGYLLKYYPEIEKAFEIGKNSKEEIKIEEVLRIIWNAASLDLKKANAFPQK